MAKWPLSWTALDQPCAWDMLSVITKMHILVSWGSVAQGVQIWTVRAKDVVWEFRVGKNPKRRCSVWLVLGQGGACFTSTGWVTWHLWLPAG